MRLPSFRRRRLQVNPAEPHVFEPISDPGLAAAASHSQGGMSGYGGMTPATVTDNYLRKRGCAVEGCNRPAGDPIHWPPDPG